MKFRLLQVNLSKKEIKRKKLQDEYIAEWIGGVGLAAKLLKENSPKAKPFSAENNVFITTSPFVGLIPGVNRIWVSTISPLTNFYTCSSAGGFFAGELRKTGFDGIQIFGKSAEPVYLLVTDKKAELLSTKKIWGKKTSETIKILKEKHGGEVACIGPAGENLVKYANTQFGVRSAGRGGHGAVLGFKKLKAVVVKGSQPFPMQDNPRIKKISEECMKELQKQMSWKEKGTLELIGEINAADAFPAENWKKSHFDKENKIDFKALKKHIINYYSCFNCPIGCGRMMRSRLGTCDGPEYESVWAFGSNCNIPDTDLIISASLLCDDYGLDTLNTAGAVAWLKECSEKKLIDYEWKSNEQILELIKMIAERKGIGNLLAEGTRNASKKVKGSERFSIDVRGMNLPAYDPRGIRGMALTYTLGPRYGCHLKAWSVGAELRMGLNQRLSGKGKAELVSNLMNARAITDSVSVCSFVDVMTNERIAALLSIFCNKKFTVENLKEIGRKIVDLERSIDVERGIKKKDDILPFRVLEEETIVSGRRVRIGRKNFEEMKKEFYEIRGW